ncbi:hypothetical protein D3C84_746920 [compost metagenome]
MHQLRFKLFAFVDFPLQLNAGFRELPGSAFDHLRQLVDLHTGPFGHVPFGQQGVGHLLHFNIVERFFQNQQAIMGLQAIEQFIPGIIGIGGAHHHLQARVVLP